MKKILVAPDSIFNKIIEIVLILLNATICGIFVLETYTTNPAYKEILFRAEVIIVTIFIIEYAIRLKLADKKLKFIFNAYAIVDLITILPTVIFFLPIQKGWEVIKIIRVIRIFRIFRFLRFIRDNQFFFGTISMHLLKVSRLIFTIFTIFFISSGLFFQVENQVNSGINNFGDSFYYTVVTLTTVGFGDITPQSTGGRWVTVFMIISGIILIPWQASQIVREWIKMSDKRNIICPGCGLSYHDKDASHCKSCGHIIYQEFEGNL